MATTACLQEEPVEVHADWRADNIRVSQNGERIVAIYDWESIRVEPEAIAVGQIAAMHSIDWSQPDGPQFASGAECLPFGETVEAARRKPFSAPEWFALRAGIVLSWCYTASCEHTGATVGDDKSESEMRNRLAGDCEVLLAPFPDRAPQRAPRLAVRTHGSTGTR